jgi:Bacterial self-protective colicin-like immunity
MQMDSNALARYGYLVQSLISREIDARTFERIYLERFKNDPTDWSEAEYEILNDLFGDVDAFCSDPQFCGPDDLNEEQLRHKAKIALKKLQALRGAAPSR